MFVDYFITFLNLCVKTLNDYYLETEGVTSNQTKSNTDRKYNIFREMQKSALKTFVKRTLIKNGEK
jgi:hypothetical protein